MSNSQNQENVGNIYPSQTRIFEDFLVENGYVGTEITPKYSIYKKDSHYIRVPHSIELNQVDIQDLLIDSNLLTEDFELYYQHKKALVGFDKLIDLSGGTLKRNNENNTEQ